MADILNNINKNPTTYANIQMFNINNSNGQDYDQIYSNLKQGTKTRNSVLKGQLSVARKELMIQETIRLCFKLVKSKKLDRDKL